MRSRVYVTVRCPSVCPSLRPSFCPIIRPQQRRDGFAAERRGSSRYRSTAAVAGASSSNGVAARRTAAADAGSATLSAELTRLNTELFFKRAASGGSRGCPGCPDKEHILKTCRWSLRFLAEQGAS